MLFRGPVLDVIRFGHGSNVLGVMKLVAAPAGSSITLSASTILRRYFVKF